MKGFNAALVSVFILSAFSFSNMAYAEQLSKWEIILLFSGKTADCIKTKDKSTCVTFMGNNGEVTRLTHKDKKLRQGKWHADSDNHLCIKWQGKSKDLCFTVHSNEDGTYNLNKKGKTKSIISGFTTGDTTKNQAQPPQ